MSSETFSFKYYNSALAITTKKYFCEKNTVDFFFVFRDNCNTRFLVVNSSSYSPHPSKSDWPAGVMSVLIG